MGRGAAQEGAALRLRLADFTFPRARIDLGDAALAGDWRDRLARGMG